MSDSATVPLNLAGITLLGVSTGLDPAVLLAGLAGGLWAQSYAEAVPIWKRLLLTLLASVVSGYLAPAVALGLASLESARGANLQAHIIVLPVAVLVGFLMHRVIGPLLEWAVRKKTEDIVK